MPSSAEEFSALKEDPAHRKDSLQQPLSKKQKKKNNLKKIAAAVKPVEDTAEHSPSPPLDFLIPPTLNQDLLSSSPEANCSDKDPIQESPPLVTGGAVELEQEQVDVSYKPAGNQAQPALSKPKPIDINGGTVKHAYGSLDPPIAHDDRPASVPFRGPFGRTASFTPSVSISPPTLQARLRSPQASPRPHTVLPRVSDSRPDSRTMTSHARRPSFPDPLPPHMPQKHFSRLPDAAFSLLDVERTTRDSLYFCGFDRLDGVSHNSRDTTSNIVLSGSEGALDILRCNRNRHYAIGRLEGLRGSVIEAKILPSPSGRDTFRDYRPLVACVLHGPALEHESDAVSRANHYETTVEVFSLSTAQSLGVVWRSTPQRLPYPIGDALFTRPAPEGAISIAAEERYLTVTSGESGEIFIFVADETAAENGTPSFRCAAKYWTRLRVDNELYRAEGAAADQSAREIKTRSIPLVSLSRRWLAISPPMLSSSQKSIDGTAITTSSYPDPPGLNAYVSPAPASVDCEVDTPSGPGLLNRVTKQATNEVLKGAQWVGEQSMSMLKNYWGRATSTGEISPSGPGQRFATNSDPYNFPPTHASGRDPTNVKIESSLISIIDLDMIGNHEAGKVKNPQMPLATFQLADGCSFLSFAPNGLSLLITNQAGDSSTLWDLMRVTDSKVATSLIHTTPQIPGATGLVRKINTFSRVSPSMVVDVQWSIASHRMGILTSKGTVHLHELPRTDPLSSTVRMPSSQAAWSHAESPSPSTSPHDAGPGWINGVRSGLQTVSGHINAMRSTSYGGGSLVATTRQSLNQASVAARYASGRAVRNGYNTALEGAYSLRHSQDNKIRLKSTTDVVRPRCFQWLAGKDEGLIATLADSSLCTYTVKSNYHVQGKRTTIVLDASRKAGPPQNLPAMTPTHLPPAVLGWLNPDGPHGSCARAGVHGFWTLNNRTGTTPPFVGAAAAHPETSSSSAQQDKETCPQYLPLHRLRQVTLYAFDERHPKTNAALGVGLESEPWLFGEPLTPRERVNIAQAMPGRQRSSREDDEAVLEGVIGHMEDDFALDDAMLDGGPANYGEAGRGQGNRLL